MLGVQRASVDAGCPQSSFKQTLLFRFEEGSRSLPGNRSELRSVIYLNGSELRSNIYLKIDWD